MEYKLILSFIGASVLLTLMPGPDNIFVLTESITKGQRHGIAISLGLVLGVMIHTLIAATGLSIIIQKSIIAFESVKYLGALYLFYLAFSAMKEKKTHVALTKENENTVYSFWKLVRTGFFMNVLNRKVTFFFIAFLPQFIIKTGYHVTLQMIIFGLLFMIQAFIIFSMLSILSGKLSNYLNNSRFWEITKISKIIVLGVLGLTLAMSKNKNEKCFRLMLKF
jgi:threonine/homoserine/homoserine lactone efflux protein